MFLLIILNFPQDFPRTGVDVVFVTRYDVPAAVAFLQHMSPFGLKAACLRWFLSECYVISLIDSLVICSDDEAGVAIGTQYDPVTRFCYLVVFLLLPDGVFSTRK